MNLFKIHPEIISIHVPKTAGSTFHAILKKNYGMQLKHIQEHESMHKWNNGLPYRCNKPFVKAVHGHIEAHGNWINQYPNSRIIAWVRDPVERVTSAYYHWKKEIDHKDHHHELFMELQPDLVQFVEMPDFAPTVNALQTYLGCLKPADYFFIGRTEHFDADLQILGKKLNWKYRKYEKKKVNEKKPEISSTVRGQLRQALKSEYELYNELLKSKRDFQN